MEFIFLGTVFNGGVLCCTMLVIIFLAFLARGERDKRVVVITNDSPNSEALKSVYDAWHKKKIINEYQTVFLGVGGVPVMRVPNELLD